MKLREIRRLKCQASRAKTYRTTFHMQNLRIDTVSHCSNSPEASRRHWRLCWREQGFRLTWQSFGSFSRTACDLHRTLLGTLTQTSEFWGLTSTESKRG